MKSLRILFAAALISASCSDNDDREAPLGTYDGGILIVSEGNSQTGTITYASDDLQTLQHDIFSLVNPQQSVGGFVQSMFFDGNRAFIISNFANKITVVNRYTFAYMGTIDTGLYHPRYGVALDGKAYVTNMAGWETGADDYVAVINLSTLALESPIMLGNYAERIDADHGKVVVANGAFGAGDSITIIDAASGSVEEIAIGFSPNSIDIENGIVYAMANSATGESAIVKVPLNAPENASSLMCPPSVMYASNLVEEDGMLYFTAGRRIFKVSPSASSVSDVPLVDTQSTSMYIGYGFAVEDGRIYICEATEDFTSDGKVLVYGTNGQFISEIPAGVGPNSVYFN